MKPPEFSPSGVLPKRGSRFDRWRARFAPQGVVCGRPANGPSPTPSGGVRVNAGLTESRRSSGQNLFAKPPLARAGVCRISSQAFPDRAPGKASPPAGQGPARRAGRASVDPGLAERARRSGRKRVLCIDLGGGGPRRGFATWRFADGKARRGRLGRRNLCTRRDSCRFGPNSLSLCWKPGSTEAGPDAGQGLAGAGSRRASLRTALCQTAVGMGRAAARGAPGRPQPVGAGSFRRTRPEKLGSGSNQHRFASIPVRPAARPIRATGLRLQPRAHGRYRS